MPPKRLKTTTKRHKRCKTPTLKTTADMRDNHKETGQPQKHKRKHKTTAEMWDNHNEAQNDCKRTTKRHKKDYNKETQNNHRQLQPQTCAQLGGCSVFPRARPAVHCLIIRPCSAGDRRWNLPPLTDWLLSYRSASSDWGPLSGSALVLYNNQALCCQNKKSVIRWKQSVSVKLNVCAIEPLSASAYIQSCSAWQKRKSSSVRMYKGFIFL